MHGRTFKAAIAILTFSLAAPLANAAEKPLDTNLFKAKMGCMTCHKDSVNDADEPSDESDSDESDAA